MYRVCKFCGKGFNARTNNEHYCSVSCRQKSFYYKHKADKPPKEKRKCLYCGAEFTPVQERSRFCSRACSEKARRRRKDGTEGD